MADVTLIITDTNHPYWRRWDFENREETTTGITNANVSPSGSSATTFTFALKPKVVPIGQGTRLSRFNIPGKDGIYMQATGSDALIIQLSGELHNTRSKTASAIADRDCLAWAQNETVDVKLTLDDGTVVSNMVVSSFDFKRTGDVVGGYVYNIELIEKLT